MQSSSILCYSPNPISTHLHLSGPHALAFFHGKNQLNSKPVVSFSCKSPWPSLHKRPQSRFAIKSSATKEIVETTSSASSFVETGYIFGVHGLQGEVRVKPNTDFPELRFSEPGTRWLKQQVMGIETIKEIELVEGRGHPGKNWIVKFNDINTVEEAQKIVGATILVTDEDRPALEEGEFYTRDLIGMRVILKESGESVGTVVNVFNSGASDLLHVKLSSIRNIPDQNGKSNVVEGDSGQLAWVPFVKAIVPVVDPEKGEMLITPPKGLLELNIRSNDKSKKERRELEWKERQKFQRRLMAAKKKLREINQQHVFHGFRHGEKDEKSLLANQIVTVNSKLLRQALQSIENPSTRLNLLDVLSVVPRSNTLKVSKSKKPSDPYSKMQREGCLLTSSGKTAMVLMLDGIKKTSDANEDLCVLMKALLEDENRFAKIEDRKTVPLVLVTSFGSSSLQELFLDNDYFAFDPKKVWFLEDGKLPVVSNTFGEHKILMKSPWEILQRPIGSGGLITLFSSQEPLLDQLSEIGIEYIELCNAKRKREDGHALLGLVHSRKLNANVGIRLVKGLTQEEDFQMIFSLSFFRKLTKRIKELRFEAVSSCNSYVEKVDKDWVNVIPTTPNSYEFRSSIYNVLDTTPVDKVCVLDSRESRN
ncbi:16S rRNA processing protein RimM family [Striga hermonthica]|uniref:16S rRNA processing protein RimM family n=1 Tax=Striga hermonthica TaxID=68872 RepID=A0A9N7RJK2_STRHE|nr:16S rRNA processing protein RimM family [Striga hermonthica]